MGVTGFIGSGLPELLAGRGISTTGLSRKRTGEVKGVERWQDSHHPDLAGHEIVINLAGAAIDRRWTDEAKREFRESRVGATNRLVEAMAKLPEDARPKVLVNGSAVGIYGDRGDDILKEDARAGTGYLADLCRDWEQAAEEAESLGIRVVTLRTGVVLGKGGQAYEKMKTVFKCGIGGRMGDGNQWMPWIHVADLRGAIVHAALSGTMRGPMNGCAPYPERNRDFTRKLGEALHRPALIPAPAFALRIVLGEFASALLASERAIPAALDSEGFQFEFPTLETALADLA